jgi:hypothetical protein
LLIGLHTRNKKKKKKKVGKFNQPENTKIEKVKLQYQNKILPCSPKVLNSSSLPYCHSVHWTTNFIQ